MGYKGSGTRVAVYMGSRARKRESENEGIGDGEGVGKERGSSWPGMGDG